MINAINKFFATKSLKDIMRYLIYFIIFMFVPYIYDFYELLKGEDSDEEYRPRKPPQKRAIPKKQPVNNTPICHGCHHYPSEIVLQRDKTPELIIQHPFTQFQRIADDESVSDKDSHKSCIDSEEFD